MDHVIEMELGHNFPFVKISFHVFAILLTGTDEAESCVECPEALEGRFLFIVLHDFLCSLCMISLFFS